MKHGRAWVDDLWPGSLVLEAGARLSRFPDRKRPGEWITHTVREDLFGVFDLAVFPMPRMHGGYVCADDISLIQVTTITDDSMSAVNERKTKVAKWVRAYFPELKPHWLANVYVVGWVARKHLRIWWWDWKPVSANKVGTWVEADPHLAKLPKQAPSASASTAPADSDLMPF